MAFLNVNWLVKMTLCNVYLILKMTHLIGQSSKLINITKCLHCTTVDITKCRTGTSNDITKCRSDGLVGFPCSSIIKNPKQVK